MSDTLEPTPLADAHKIIEHFAGRGVGPRAAGLAAQRLLKHLQSEPDEDRKGLQAEVAAITEAFDASIEALEKRVAELEARPTVIYNLPPQPVQPAPWQPPIGPTWTTGADDTALRVSQVTYHEANPGSFVSEEALGAIEAQDAVRERPEDRHQGLSDPMG